MVGTVYRKTYSGLLVRLEIHKISYYKTTYHYKATLSKTSKYYASIPLYLYMYYTEHICLLGLQNNINIECNLRQLEHHLSSLAYILQED